MQIDINVSAFRGLRKAIREVATSPKGRREFKKHGRRAFIPAGKILAAEMRKHVPRRTGGLKASIKYEVRKFPRRDDILIVGGNYKKFGYRLNFVNKGTKDRYTSGFEFRGRIKRAGRSIAETTRDNAWPAARTAYRAKFAEGVDELIVALKKIAEQQTKKGRRR